eukprot:396566-Prorocentrum_lima.AAC.1
METVASEDDLLKKAMLEDLSQPSLRNPQEMEDVSTCVRVVLGEVKSTRASRDVSARFHPTHPPTSSAVIANPAQKGKGTCNKFSTDK